MYLFRSICKLWFKLNWFAQVPCIHSPAGASRGFKTIKATHFHAIICCAVFPGGGAGNWDIKARVLARITIPISHCSPPAVSHQPLELSTNLRELSQQGPILVESTFKISKMIYKDTVKLGFWPDSDPKIITSASICFLQQEECPSRGLSHQWKTLRMFVDSSSHQPQPRVIYSDLGCLWEPLPAPAPAHQKSMCPSKAATCSKCAPAKNRHNLAAGKK